MVSVVIPTLDRTDVLEQTLARLAQQTPPGDGFEVIVVANGSPAATAALVRGATEKFPVPLRLLEEPRPGPASARNRGAEAARGSILLFLGDDMLPATSGLVRGHAEAHERYADPLCAILGHATWDPREPITPFMHWLENGGPQFSYGDIAPGPVMTQRYFYTANISLSTQTFLEAGGFDERFPYAAVEDIELGARLESLGVTLVYEPQLVVHHLHPTTLVVSLRRMERVGRSAALYYAQGPERPLRDLPVPRLPVRLAAPLARLLARPNVPRAVREQAWRFLHRAAYERGFAAGPPRPDDLAAGRP